MYLYVSYVGICVSVFDINMYKSLRQSFKGIHENHFKLI